jgi:hypothetical protein
MHTRTHTYVHIHAHLHARTCIHIHIHTYTYNCTVSNTLSNMYGISCLGGHDSDSESEPHQKVLQPAYGHGRSPPSSCGSMRRSSVDYSRCGFFNTNAGRMQGAAPLRSSVGSELDAAGLSVSVSVEVDTLTVTAPHSCTCLNARLPGRHFGTGHPEGPEPLCGAHACRLSKVRCSSCTDVAAVVGKGCASHSSKGGKKAFDVKAFHLRRASPVKLRPWPDRDEDEFKRLVLSPCMHSLSSS